ncbi:hypothetical protein M9458_037482, partial [Cirrhinus mrigala]
PGIKAGSALYAKLCKVLQAKVLCTMDESGQSSDAFKELRTATDLVLHATKATVQSIGKALTNLVVLECHLWLNLKVIKDTDKITFLDSPDTPKGLSGPVLDGFTKRFITAQKSLQAMCHFLPNISRQKVPSSQQSAKPTLPEA